MSDYSDIISNYKNMSVSELGGSLLQRKGEIADKQRKQDRKAMRIQQAFGVLLAGQGLMKNAFKRRQKELTNQQTLDLLTVDQDSKQIANLSTILNYKPEGYNSLEDFTKEINPATNKIYTAKENSDRFFRNTNNKQGYIDKISPIIDQQIQFADKDMKQDDTRRYDILQEVGARSIFEKMITDNNHVKYLNGLEKMFSEDGATREDILRDSMGITSARLSSEIRKKYASEEAQYRDQGMFGALAGLFKGIGKDKEDKGELNLFKQLKPEHMQDPDLRDILDTMNLKSMVLESVDDGLKAARLSPDRYLNMVNNKKHEPLRKSMLDVTLFELKREIDAGVALDKFGLSSFLDEGVMDDLFDDLTNKNSVAGVAYSKRAAALSLRFKNDPQFALELFKGANKNASTAEVQEFIGAISEDGFRNKFSALLVLEAGAYNPPGMNWSGSQFFGAETALVTKGLGNLQEFDRNFQTKHGYNPAQAADKIDPLVAPMFNLKTGVSTKEYNRLSVEGKDNAWYKMAQQILTKPNIAENEKLEVLEKFNETTPNPRNLPVMEYLESKKEEEESGIARNVDNLVSLPNVPNRVGRMGQLQLLPKFELESSIRSLNKSLEELDDQDLSVNEKAKRKLNIEEKLQNYKQALAYRQPEQVTLREQTRLSKAYQTKITKLEKELKDTSDLRPSQITKKQNELTELEGKLNLVNNPEQPSEPEAVDTINLDITKPKAVGEDVIKKAIEAVVDIQGVSDEYKQTTKNFLGYVAKAESSYGLDKDTFNNEKDAWGPMQIIMSQSLAEIERRLNPKLAIGQPIREYNELLKDNLNIDLNNITKEDLEQPVVSAAVARAYFMVAADAIPTEPEAMADYYVDNYVRYDPKSSTYKEDREEARQNFLVNNGFVSGGMKQTIKSLLGR